MFLSVTESQSLARGWKRRGTEVAWTGVHQNKVVEMKAIWTTMEQ